MLRFNLPARVSLVALTLGACASAEAATITEWNFGTLPVNTGPDNTPAPTAGVGTATSLGMTNNFTYSNGVTGSTTFDDILNDTADGAAGNGNVWRVRGANPGNGWNLAAPQYSQGAEFDASTLGFSDIGLSFSWVSTAQGILNMQVQYTTNGSTWTNVGPLLTSSQTYQTDTINFAALGISSVDNDADFGVRLVSAFNPTLGTYASSNSGKGGAPIVYNNNSGNWRFADVSISGTPAAPVPLPAAAWMMLSGLGGLATRIRRRKIEVQ
jgi:hypothetical protein